MPYRACYHTPPSYRSAHVARAGHTGEYDWLSRGCSLPGLRKRTTHFALHTTGSARRCKPHKKSCVARPSGNTQSGSTPLENAQPATHSTGTESAAEGSNRFSSPVNLAISPSALNPESLQSDKEQTPVSPSVLPEYLAKVATQEVVRDTEIDGAVSGSREDSWQHLLADLQGGDPFNTSPEEVIEFLHRAQALRKLQYVGTDRYTTELLAARLTTKNLDDFSASQLIAASRSIDGRGHTSKKLADALQRKAVTMHLGGFSGTDMHYLVLSHFRDQNRPPHKWLEMVALQVAANRDKVLDRLPPHELVRLAWALAKLGCGAGCSEAIHSIGLELTAEACASLSSKDIVLALWAYAQVRSRPEGLLGHLTAQLSERMLERPTPHGRRGLTPELVVLAMWSLARLPPQPGKLLPLMAERVQVDFDALSLQPRHISQVLWAFARLGYRPDAVLQRVGTEVCTPACLARFKPPQLEALAWALAKLDHNPGAAALEAIGSQAVLGARMLSCGAISNLLWAYQRFAYLHAPMMDAFAPLIIAKIRECSAHELAEVARAYARFNLRHEPLFGAIAARALARLGSFTTPDMLRMLMAFNSLSLEPQEFLAAVDEWSDQRLQGLSPYALAMALWGFARMGNSNPRLLTTCTDLALQKLDKFSPAELGRVLWALATLGFPSEALLDAAVPIVAGRAAAFDGKALANALWGLAKFGRRPGMEAMLGAVEREALPRLPSFGPQALVNTLWAFASLGQRPGDGFLAGAARAALAEVALMQPQGFSNLVWAFATLRYHPPELLQAIAPLALQQLEAFEPQQLANLLWAYATLREPPGQPLLAAAAQLAVQRRGQFKAQELFNLVWAYATLRCHLPELMDPLADEIAARTVEFQSQELVNTLWAYGKLAHRSPATTRMLRQAYQEVPARLASLQEQNLATLLWGMARYGQPPTQILAAVVEEVGRRGPLLTPQHLSMIMLALGSLSYHPGSLVDQVAALSRSKLPHFRGFELVNLLRGYGLLGLVPQALLAAAQAGPAGRALLAEQPHYLAELFWALVCFQAYDGPLYEQLCRSLEQRPPRWSPAAQWAPLLAHALQLARVEHGRVPALPKALQTRLDGYWRRLAQKASLSSTERQVAQAAEQLAGAEVATLRPLTRSGLKLPISLKLPRGQVALEVLGLGQVTRGAVAQDTGHTLCRHRLIEAEGWEVMVIEAASWKQLQGMPEAQQAFLEQLLQEYL